MPDHVNTNFVIRLSQCQWDELIFTDGVQVGDRIAWGCLAWRRYHKSCSGNLCSKICQLSNLAEIIIFEINLKCLAFFGVDWSLWYIWHITWRKFWYMTNFLNIDHCPLRGRNYSFLLKKIKFGAVLVCGSDLRENFYTKKQVIAYQYTAWKWI